MTRQSNNNNNNNASRSGDPRIQAALLRQAGLYRSGQKTSLATRETPMIIHNQEEGKSRGPLTALKRMVIIPRKRNMDHLKVHLTSESGKKMERN